jgi:2-polyprenyl-6-methoxyphenol hydroxylase-like FAD-dependent oxidoreductase
MVIYPIRNNIDSEGRQLINWVAAIEAPAPADRDWNCQGKIEDFIGVFENWHFHWLDVPAVIRAADFVLECPMVDQDPLPRWTHGLVTLLGDAAHPMAPRGSSGGGQAIIDARVLADCLRSYASPAAALQEYERKRRDATSRLVLTNRSNPPDAILREIYDRTGDKPFERIEDVISHKELAAISERYKQIAEQLA